MLELGRTFLIFKMRPVKICYGQIAALLAEGQQPESAVVS